jgi:hypothetical protein
LIIFLLLLVGVAAGRADAIDDSAALQSGIRRSFA